MWTEKAVETIKAFAGDDAAVSFDQVDELAERLAAEAGTHAKPRAIVAKLVAMERAGILT